MPGGVDYDYDQLSGNIDKLLAMHAEVQSLKRRLRHAQRGRSASVPSRSPEST